MALRLAASRSTTTLFKSATTTSTTSTASRALFSSGAASDYVQTAENFEYVLDKFAQIRACAVLRTATSEACPKAMQAAIDGGFKIVEFTLTTPDW
jgi:hypothetical protein